MNSVHDVAKYIVRKLGRVSAMKLQKLVYYAQAWSLVWDEKPLFRQRIEAWANGPVVSALYEEHRGRFEVSDWPLGDPKALSAEARETIDAVIKHYGSKTAQQLSDLTHREDPWRNARVGLPDGERSNVPITTAALHEYYSAL
jgi:uncharacterized phage-associated protein